MMYNYMRGLTSYSTMLLNKFDSTSKYLQDVSDRVEKLDYSVQPLKILEKNSKHITRDDWNLHLDESITSDLRKYRGYHGNSVRDLLRALRNKVNIIKHN